MSDSLTDVSEPATPPPFPPTPGKRKSSVLRVFVCATIGGAVLITAIYFAMLAFVINPPFEAYGPGADAIERDVIGLKLEIETRGGIGHGNVQTISAGEGYRLEAVLAPKRKHMAGYLDDGTPIALHPMRVHTLLGRRLQDLSKGGPDLGWYLALTPLARQGGVIHVIDETGDVVEQVRRITAGRPAMATTVDLALNRLGDTLPRARKRTWDAKPRPVGPLDAPTVDWLTSIAAGEHELLEYTTRGMKRDETHTLEAIDTTSDEARYRRGRAALIACIGAPDRAEAIVKAAVEANADLIAPMSIPGVVAQAPAALTDYWLDRWYVVRYGTDRSIDGAMGPVFRRLFEADPVAALAYANRMSQKLDIPRAGHSAPFASIFITRAKKLHKLDAQGAEFTRFIAMIEASPDGGMLAHISGGLRDVLPERMWPIYIRQSGEGYADVRFHHRPANQFLRNGLKYNSPEIIRVSLHYGYTPDTLTYSNELGIYRDAKKLGNEHILRLLAPHINRDKVPDWVDEIADKYAPQP